MNEPVSLTGWLSDPRPDAGIRFLAQDGTWTGPKYPAVADRILRMAAVVRQLGLAGRRVGIVPGNAAEFIVQLYALVASGATCVPLPPLLPTDDPVEYQQRVRRLIELVHPDAIVATKGGALAGSPVQALPSIAALGDVAPAKVIDTEPEHTTIIQFSSGTSGAQKAVKVSRRALDAQLTAIRDWMEVGPADRTASWLPFYHDMGLVGIAMRNMSTQTDLMLMSSMQFLRKPQEWLWCFGRHGATLGTAPAFGFVHASRKVRKEDLEGCDFSGWRGAIIGAEPLRSGQLESFLDLLAPYGFTARSFCPAYGLAEATLAVTGLPPDEEPAVLPAGWKPNEPGDREALGVTVRHSSLQTDQIVGSGRPIPGVKVSIRDIDGKRVPDGSLGEIWVGGATLADGYEPPDPVSWPPGWFRTGDVGCLVQGQLFVFGRVSDSFQVAGELILAEQAEHRIQQAVPEAGVLVLLASRTEGAGVTVVAESNRAWTPETADRVRQAISDLFRGTETDLVVVERGGIPRTTSGKPRRRECWRRFVGAG
jgi:acyl-CoA synthetase (AMP-forming)/AMP-acid ligase II